MEELHWSKGKESLCPVHEGAACWFWVASKRSAGKILWFLVTRHSSPLASAVEAGIRKSLSTVCCTGRWQMSCCLQERACLLMSLGQDEIAHLCTVAKKGKAFSSVTICHRILASLSLSRGDPVSVCPLPNSSSSKDSPLWETQKTGEAEEHGG